MAGTHPGASRGVAPMFVVGCVVVAVTLGLSRGVWLANLHNALLAVAFTFVGAYVLYQRPGHRVGRLFLATGVVEAVMFLGRQVGHDSGSPWLAWIGVWPLAIGLGLTSLSVIFFPDGRLPSPGWRPVVVGIVLVSGTCATVSALWPVEYEATGISSSPPFVLPGAETAGSLWAAVAHPAYAVLQVLWLVALVARWRRSGPLVRPQLLVLAVPVALSALALAVGLVLWGSPRTGVLTAALVPVGAGWAIVHGQHRVAYGALSWLTRVGPTSADLPTDLARTVAEAFSSPQACLWVGDAHRLDAIGVWPETDEDLPPTTLDQLLAGRLDARPVTSRDGVIGAVSAERRDGAGLSRAEERLLADLAAQGAWVIEHVNLAAPVADRRTADHLQALTPREQEVLDLMARGLSNAAICAELHLSIKTVEPVVSRIFDKLGLQADAARNRRVLAVRAYLHR